MTPPPVPFGEIAGLLENHAKMAEARAVELADMGFRPLWLDEAARLRAAASSLEAWGAVLHWIEGEHADVEARLAEGKGTWPGPGYIRDDTWARWHGEAYVLRRLTDRLRALSSSSTGNPTNG